MLFDDQPEPCPPTVPVSLTKYEETLALGLYAQLSQNGIATDLDAPGPRTDVIEHTLQEHRAGRLSITVRRTFHNGDQVYVEQMANSFLSEPSKDSVQHHKKRKC